MFTPLNGPADSRPIGMQVIEMPRSTGRAAIVFGGSRGIGAAIARRLAADGLAVAITYVSDADRARELVNEIQASGGAAIALRADSGDADAIARAVDETVDSLGALHVAVVNAGVLGLHEVSETSVEQLDYLLRINVRGVYLAAQAAAAKMADGGRIVTIGSNMAIRTMRADCTLYAMTKAAVAAMVKGLALDLAGRKITVNNVQPGITKTDMTIGMEALAELSPLKRFAEPDEIAGLVSYVASDAAAYITGASLTIDGGFHL